MNPTAVTDIETLEQHVDTIVRRAAVLGASQAEASASASSGLTVTVRLRDVETLEYHRGQGIGITVYFGRRKGSASTSDLSPGALEETVSKACALAQYGAEDQCAGLADEDRLATHIPDLDLYHPWPIEPADAIDMAMLCEAAALDSDARVTNSEGATVNTHTGCRVYGNSFGFLAGYNESQHSVSCAVLASQDGQMERDYEYSVARNADELSDVAGIGETAASRAVRRLGPTKLETTEAPVLYPARVARDRRDQRRQPVPQVHVFARQRRQADFHRKRDHRRVATYSARTVERAVRQRGRRDGRSPARRRGRPSGLCAGQLLRAQVADAIDW